MPPVKKTLAGVKRNMHILLTNDDGILAPGIAAIYKELVTIADVTVAAPSMPKSGASHSISLDPLTCTKVDIAGRFSGYSVEGSPADCVKLAAKELITDHIDLVVSGINYGANVGLHVYYSGTVAAAMEAAFYGIPSIALSAAFEENLDIDQAAKYCLEVIKKLLPLEKSDVVNVNIPMLSKGKPKGVKVVPQSISGYHEEYLTRSDDKGQTLYVYNSGDHRDHQSAQTDTTALTEGFITVTALHFNMTDHEKNEKLKNLQW